ncbi:MAG: hypothetical protein NT080_02685 [Spirochaetes bacterium]|nr:hypothetical protein [Spirochaetota bacterium]
MAANFRYRFAIAVFALSLAATAASFAVPLTVSYADGTVERLDGKTWRSIDIGDVVESTSTIRLDKNSVVEFESKDGARIGIASPGTYNLEDLAKKKVPQAAASVADKLGKLTSGDSGKGSAVMGVRGDITDVENLEFMVDDDPEYFWDEGFKAFGAGKWDAAAAQFDKAISCSATPDDAVKYAFYAGIAYLNMNAKVRALSSLRAAGSRGAAAASGEFAGRWCLLLASLEYEIGTVDAAKAALKRGFDGKLFGTLETDARSLQASFPVK